MSNGNKDDIKIDASSENLKFFIKFRMQSVPEISQATQIKESTIREYVKGRVAFSSAAAKVFIPISDYLEIDPHYLLGIEGWKTSDFLKEKAAEVDIHLDSQTEDFYAEERMTNATIQYKLQRKQQRKEARKHSEEMGIFKRDTYNFEQGNRDTDFVKEHLFVYIPDQDLLNDVSKRKKTRYPITNMEEYRKRLEKYYWIFKELEEKRNNTPE